jgi:hypothetical protein
MKKSYFFITETALKLDSFIGDVEDSVSSSVTEKLKSSSYSVNSEVRIY